VARDVRLKAYRAAVRGIPPQLPADEVEPIPFFGRSWYVHGPDYWLRRIVAVLLALVGLAVACAVEYGLLSVADRIGPDAGRWAWRVGWAALLVAGLVRPLRALAGVARRRRAGQFLRPDGVAGTSRPGGGAGIGALARTGDTVASGALVVGVLLFFGWFVTFLIFTLQPEYGVEHDARLRLQRRHGRSAPSP